MVGLMVGLQFLLLFFPPNTSKVQETPGDVDHHLPQNYGSQQVPSAPNVQRQERGACGGTEGQSRYTTARIRTASGEPPRPLSGLP